MKKYFMLLLGVALFISLVGMPSCAGGGSPSDAVKAFYSAINEGDLNKANQYTAIYKKVRETYDIAELAGWISEVKILDEQRQKAFGTEAAQVEVDVILKQGAKEQLPYGVAQRAGGKHIIWLEKYDGEWKITLGY